MAKKIRVRLSSSSLDSAIKELQAFQKQLRDKCLEICKRAASLGATSASLEFSRAIYTGPKDFDVSVEPRKNGYIIKADGKTILFLEFGAGIRYGDGHPQAAEFGMGPGTYPDGKGHWDDPNGWYLPKDKGGGHTYGNPHAMPMYNAARSIERELERIAREVFAS